MRVIKLKLTLNPDFALIKYAQRVKIWLKKMKKHILLAIILTFSLTANSSAEYTTEYFAEEMAILHIKDINPGDAFLGKEMKPSRSMIAEFKWILDSIKIRSLNPGETIANTIILTWTALNKAGHTMTILDTARELLRISKNTKLFGSKRGNFRMTSEFWLISKLKNIDIEIVIKSKTNNH